MPVQETLMAAGRWSLDLVEDTPYSVREKFDNGFQIFITPVPVKPPSQLSLTELLAQSRYTGVMLLRSGRQLTGMGLLYYLGDNTLGAVVNPGGWANITMTFQDWVNNLMRFAGVSSFTVPNSPYTKGTISTIGATTYEFKLGGQLRKPMLDLVCSIFAGEYRVKPNNVFDAGAEADLFDTTPTVVVLPRAGVPDLTYASLRALELDQEVDYTDRMTGWYVVGAGEGNAAVTSESNTTWAQDLLGGNLYRQRIMNAPEATTTAAAGQIGQEQWYREQDAVESARLSTSTHDIRRYIEPGDSIYVYDPQSGLWSNVTQIRHGGRVMFPATVRVMGITWPIEDGMGVYLRNDVSGAILDLTPYVAWESGPVSYDIGAPKKPLVSSMPNLAVERRLR